MKALMSLQEEQEEYILKTQREKQELKQEMEAKSRALDEAQRQLEEVRANRHRVDQDVVVRGTLSVRPTPGLLGGSVLRSRTGLDLVARRRMRQVWRPFHFYFLSPTGRSEEASPGEHQRQTLERPDEQADAAHRTRRYPSRLEAMSFFKSKLNAFRISHSM